MTILPHRLHISACMLTHPSPLCRISQLISYWGCSIISCRTLDCVVTDVCSGPGRGEARQAQGAIRKDGANAAVPSRDAWLWACPELASSSPPGHASSYRLSQPLITAVVSPLLTQWQISETNAVASEAVRACAAGKYRPKHAQCGVPAKDSLPGTKQPQFVNMQGRRC